MAGIAGSGYLVPLDTLAIRLTDAVQAVTAQDGRPETRTPSWAATVATHLSTVLRQYRAPAAAHP